MNVKFSKEQIIALFEAAVGTGEVKRYAKFTKVLFRLVAPGETVITTVGGKVETFQTITDNKSVVVMNFQIGLSAEQYVLSSDKFEKRYEKQDDCYNIGGVRWDLAKAVGEVDAFEYQSEDNVVFDAPWGEEMFLEKGDMLCRVPGSLTDIYRIARSEFDGTYEKVPVTAPVEAL